MIFKDENGREYEAVPALRAEADHITIRPIQPEPKWKVSLLKFERGYLIHTELPDTLEDQAQLIKECVEELLGCLNTSSESVGLLRNDFSQYRPTRLLNLMDKARSRPGG